jgi:hypothetical protein
MCAAGSQSWLVMRVLERMFCAELCAIREEQGDLKVIYISFGAPSMNSTNKRGAVHMLDILGLYRRTLVPVTISNPAHNQLNHFIIRAWLIKLFTC